MPPTLFNPRSFIKSLSEHPEQLFWTFALLHLFLWTIIPTLTSPNAPLDVIEGYAWGREWQLGTYKHPPMQAWCLQILAVLTDRAAWAHFLASQIAIVVAFWAVWRTGLRMMSGRAALIGVMLLESIVYYNFTSTEFNPNVLQLPFWALTAYAFYRGVKDDSILDWLMVGLWGACALYSKYSSAVLLLTLLILLIAHPVARKKLRSGGPYIAFLVMLALFLPHMIWLKNHDYLPFTYTMERLQAVKPHMLPNFLFSPLILVAGQAVVLIAFAVLFLVFYGRKDRADDVRTDNFDRAFLTAVTFGPCALTFFLALIFGFSIHDMWGTPFWGFIGLWAVARFRPSFSDENTTRFVYAWGFIFGGMLLFFLGSNILSPYLDSKTKRVHFPGKQLATYVTDVWHDRYHAPLRFAVGDTWPAGNVGYYAPDRPHVFIFGDKTISPWIKAGDFEKYGGVIVWCQRHCIGQQEAAEDYPDFVKEKFPNAELMPPFSLARQTDADISPVKMGWAIIAPNSAPAPAPTAVPATVPAAAKP